MKILFLARWLPYPASNGSKQRIYNLIKRLAAFGHEIELVSFYETGDDPQLARDHLSQFCRRVELIFYKPYQPTSLRARSGFFSLEPRALVSTYQPAMAALVEGRLAVGGLERVVVSQLDMATYGRLAVKYGVSAVLEELEVGVVYDQFYTAPNLKTRLRYGLTWFKFSNYVRRLAHYYQAISVVSERERRLIEPLVSPRQVTVLPNGADLEPGRFRPYQIEERAPRLIFNGSLTFKLNREAIQYFLAEIFPIITQAVPEVELVITGRYPETEPLADPARLQKVRLTGFVPDLQPLMHSSRVCVVPLLQGGGTRLKILEAFALGTPVVTTSKGAEGLEAVAGEHLLIADSPTEFAQAVLSVYSQPALAAKLAENAYRLVQTRFDWDIIAADLDALIRA